MSKTFAQAPKPKPLTAEAIAAFERGGAGQDTQAQIAPKAAVSEPATEPMGEPVNVEKREPTKRLSIDLPKSLHRRFKTACSNADKKMVAEIVEFIERRTEELEGKK
jgi:hypothetical protein